MAKESGAHPVICPNLIRRPHGDWLAASPQGASLCIGVIGATEREARDYFEATIARWFEIIRDTNNGAVT